VTQQKHFVRPAAGATAAPESAKMAGFRLQMIWRPARGAAAAAAGSGGIPRTTNIRHIFATEGVKFVAMECVLSLHL